MIPFRVSFEPGISLYEQVVYAAKKAVVSGQLRAGDSFPSVRELNKTFPVSQDFTFSIARMALSEATVDTVAPLAYLQRNFEIQNLRLGDFQRDAAPVSP